MPLYPTANTPRGDPPNSVLTLWFEGQGLGYSSIRTRVCGRKGEPNEFHHLDDPRSHPGCRWSRPAAPGSDHLWHRAVDRCSNGRSWRTQHFPSNLTGSSTAGSSTTLTALRCQGSLNYRLLRVCTEGNRVFGERPTALEGGRIPLRARPPSGWALRGEVCSGSTPNDQVVNLLLLCANGNRYRH